MSSRRTDTERARRRLPMAERLEPRVLYSADALGPLAPLLVADERDAEHPEGDLRALLDAAASTVSAVPDGIGPADVVFVDGFVADADGIARELRASGANVVVIEPDEDGLVVVSRTLAALDEVEAVHLFAHGESGSLALGTATLDAAALDANRIGIARWGDALAPGGDLLLYGCDVAAGDVGIALVAELAAVTGADVAASDDRSGHASRGANWTLEVRSGDIEATVLDDAALGGDWRHALETFTVTETADGLNAPNGIDTLADLAAWEAADPANRATLRDALLVAARNGEADRIVLGAGVFELEGTGDDTGRDGDLDIDGTLVVVGAGRDATTIRMGGTDRVFDVMSDANLTLEKMTITGGEADDGGGIFVFEEGSLTLDDVAVTNNVATAGGGGIFARDDTTLMLRNVEVSGNRADSKGGGLYAGEDSVTRIFDSRIESNTAGDENDGSSRGKGGGIHADVLRLERTVLADNHAYGGKGGALFAEGRVVGIDVLVQGNTATKDGGGAHLHGGGAFLRVTFAGNDSGGAGGGLSAHSAESTGFVNATFSGNTAVRGGALHVDGGRLSAFHSTFHGNEDQNRGAIWVESSPSVLIGSSVFDANTSVSGGPSVSADVTSFGHNVFSDDVAVAVLASDREGIDPRLGPLAPSGPILLTHRPEAGSPLVDAGGGGEPDSDAGGRPLDELPDIGAHERAGESDVVYYVDDASRVLRVGADLAHPQVVVEGVPNLVDIAVDRANGRIYWLQDGGDAIGSSDLDGNDVWATPVDTTANDGATAIAVEPVHGHLIVAFRDPLDIRRFELGAIALPGEILVAGADTLGGVLDIAVAGSGTPGDPVRVFWADAGAPGVDEGIRSALVPDPDAGPAPGPNQDIREHYGSVFFVDSGVEALAVSADGRRLYWTDPESDFVVYGDLDTNVIRYVSGPGTDPRGIAVNSSGDRVFASSDAGNRLMSLSGDIQNQLADITLPSDVQAIDVLRTSDSVSTAPTLVGGSLALDVDEGDDVRIDIAAIEIEDPDTAAEDLLYRVGAPAHGEIRVAGVAGAATTFTDADLRAGRVSYVHGGGETTGDAIALVVEDGDGGTLSATIAVTVEPANDAPTLTVRPITLQEGVPLTIAPDRLEGADPDDGPTELVYSLVLPSGHGTLSVAGDPGRTTFTQQELIDGDVVIEHPFTGASDHVHVVDVSLVDADGAADTKALTITVESLNPDPPVGADDAIELAENGTATTLTGGAASVLANDSDPQGPADTLEAFVVDSPLHGTLTLDADGTFRYEHDGDESGTDRFTYVALDGAGQASDPIEVTITTSPVNDPPRLVGTVPSQAAMEGDAFRLPLPRGLWSDADPGDTLSLEATLADGSPLPAWLSGTDPDGTPMGDDTSAAPLPSVPGGFGPTPPTPDLAGLSGTPGNDDVGRLDVLVIARDAAGERSDPLLVTIEVGDRNAPPGAISLSGVDVDENHPGAPVGRLAVFDEDKDDSVALTIDDPRFVVDGDELRLAPGAALDHESEPLVPIVVTATDRAGASSSASFDLTVRDLDDGPIARADVVATSEGGVAERLANGEASVLANDGSGAGGARVELVEGPRFGTLDIDPDGTFSYAHDGGENLVDTFVYTVRDASGQLAANATVTIVVEPVNDAPTRIGEPLAATAIEGEPFTLAIGTDGFVDADEDALALRVTRADGSALPSWLTFDAAGGLLTGTPANVDVGTLALAIEASDATGETAAPLALTLDIANVNAAPAAPRLIGDAVGENDPGAVIGRLVADDEDAGDTVRFSVDDPRFVVDGDTLRLAEGVALDFEVDPVVEVSVTATDGDDASRIERIRIDVLDRNDQPVAGLPPAPDPLKAGEVYAVPPGTFVDADGDALVYRATLADGSALPGWLVFDAAAPAFTVLGPGDGGAAEALATVRLFADDGRGGSDYVELDFRRPPLLEAAIPEPPVEPPAEPPTEPPTEPPVEPPAEPPVEPVPEPERAPEPVPASPPTPVAAFEPAVAPALVPPTAAPSERVTITPEAVPSTASAAPAASATPVAELAERVDVEIETVDLASLIGERPDIGRLALASVDTGVVSLDGAARIVLEEPSIDTIDLASLLGEPDVASSRAFDGLSEAFERQQDEREERATFAQTLVGSSVGLTSGLSVGYLIWLIRGGTLMGSVLSSLPAWRFVDPLPVLDGLAGDADEDQESLESIVDDERAAPAERPPSAPPPPPG